jgi:hypothetical protein
VEELRPGVFTAIFVKLNVEAQRRTRIALAPVALAIERQAKINARNGSHRYGTPTPARPGHGPAVVSGTLVRSITHDPITRTASGYETKVGTAAGFYPPYPRRARSGGAAKRTPANKYGYYLETGRLRNHMAYPFLRPAADYVMRVAAPLIMTRAYGATWGVMSR